MRIVAYLRSMGFAVAYVGHRPVDVRVVERMLRDGVIEGVEPREFQVVDRDATEANA